MQSPEAGQAGAARRQQQEQHLRRRGTLTSLSPPRSSQLAKELAFSVVCLLEPLLLITAPTLRTAQQDAGRGLVWDCEAQKAAGLLLPGFPCGGDPLRQLPLQVCHLLAAPRFYWLTRPVATGDWVVLAWYGIHLIVIAVTAALLVATATGLLPAPSGAKPTDTICPSNDNRDEPQPRSGLLNRARAAAVEAAKSLLAAWLHVRELVLLAASPYKCGVVHMSYALLWTALYGNTSRRALWPLTTSGGFGIVVRQQSYALAALGVLAAECQQVRPHITTRALVVVAVACVSLVAAIPGFIMPELRDASGSGPPGLQGRHGGGGSPGARATAAVVLRAWLPSVLLIYGAPALYVNAPAIAAALSKAGHSWPLPRRPWPWPCSWRWPWSWGVRWSWWRRRAAPLRALALAATEPAAGSSTPPVTVPGPPATTSGLETAPPGPRAASADSPALTAAAAAAAAAAVAGPLVIRLPDSLSRSEPGSGFPSPLVTPVSGATASAPPTASGALRLRAARATAGAATTVPAVARTTFAIASGHHRRPVRSALYTSPNWRGTLVMVSKFHTPPSLLYEEAAAALRTTAMRSAREAVAGAAVTHGTAITGPRPEARVRSSRPQPPVAASTPAQAPWARALGPAGPARTAADVEAAADVETAADAETAVRGPRSQQAVVMSALPQAAAAHSPAGSADTAAATVGLQVECLTLPGCVQLAVVMRWGGRGGGDGGGGGGGGPPPSSEHPPSVGRVLRALRQSLSAAAEQMGMRELGPSTVAATVGRETALGSTGGPESAEALETATADIVGHRSAPEGETSGFPTMMYDVPAVLPYTQFGSATEPSLPYRVQLYVPQEIVADWSESMSPAPSPQPSRRQPSQQSYAPAEQTEVARLARGPAQPPQPPVQRPQRPQRRLVVLAAAPDSIAEPVIIYPPGAQAAAHGTAAPAAPGATALEAPTGASQVRSPLELLLPADLPYRLGLLPEGLTDGEVGDGAVADGGSEEVGGAVGGSDAAASPLPPTIIMLHLMSDQEGGVVEEAAEEEAVEGGFPASQSGGGEGGSGGGGGGPQRGSLPPARWLGCVPLLLAPPGPAEELQSLWCRMVEEVEQRDQQRRQEGQQQLQEQAAAGATVQPLSPYSHAGATTPPVITPEEEAPPLPAPAVPQPAVHTGYSASAAAAFRDHLAPLLDDLATVAVEAKAEAEARGREPADPRVGLLRAHVMQYLRDLELTECLDWLSAVLHCSELAAPGSPTASTQAAEAANEQALGPATGGAAAAAAAVSATAVEGPSGAGYGNGDAGRTQSAAVLGSGAAAAPPTAATTALGAALATEGGAVTNACLGLTDQVVSIATAVQQMGEPGGSVPGDPGGSSARQQSPPGIPPLGFAPARHQIRGATGDDPSPMPPPPGPPASPISPAPKFAHHWLAEPAEEGEPLWLWLRLVRRLWRLSRCADLVAGPRTPFRWSAMRASLLLCFGFRDPAREAEYAMWRIARAPTGWGPLAAAVGVGAVAVLATKLRLQRYGIQQPLMKALAGMLWLLSPMAGQILRLGLLRAQLRSPKRQVHAARRLCEDLGGAAAAAAAAAAVKDLPEGGAAVAAATGSSSAGSRAVLAKAAVGFSGGDSTRSISRGGRAGDSGIAGDGFAAEGAILRHPWLAWYDTLAAACTGLLSTVLGFVTFTCSRPELDVRQDEVGFVFGIIMGRSVFPPVSTQLRPQSQLLVSLGMAAVDLVHAHVLWGGAVSPGVLIAGVGLVAAVNLAVSAVLDVPERRRFTEAAAERGGMGGKGMSEAKNV